MLSLEEPLDYKSTDADEFLSKLQGNILKGHGRDYTAHLFIVFPKNTKKTRAWLANFAQFHVTTAVIQRQHTEKIRGTNKAGELFCSVLLSAQGYSALGVEEAKIPNDPFFRAGLKNHNDVGDPINDPPSPLWEQGFRSNLDAMVLLAHDGSSILDAEAEKTAAELKGLGCSCFVERGDKLRYDFGEPRGELEIEHFGHQDGVSNPRMILEDIAEEKKQRGSDHWDPGAPLNLAIVQEPGDDGGFGSYLVFRKLEQNVRAFRNATEKLAAVLEIDQDDAAGLAVGRHRDGTPLIPTVTPGSDADPNDFNFSSDRPVPPAAARLCPFHSHIRRSNPRGDIPHYGGPDFEFERSMRIVRRGITYGKRTALYDPDPQKQPEDGVGLLFMSFQGNLRQFAIQQAGSDGDAFPYNFTSTGDPFTGLDGIVGQPDDPATARPQPWPYGSSQGIEEKNFQMMNFVKMLGGEYFFAPSMSFLKLL